MEYLQDKEPTLMVLKEELVPFVEDTSTATEEESGLAPPPIKAKGLAAILEKMPRRVLVSTLTPAKLVDREFTTYTLEESACDPLDWWKYNLRKISLMSQLVRKYLCICGTSIPQNEHLVQEV